MLCLSQAAHAVQEGFKVVTFAKPPQITYPTGVAASGNGEVYVSVDLNSSLDQKANRGKIVKCVDTDGDGVADKFTDYVPDIDSPRSSCFVGDTLYVVNPPFLSAFRDKDNDGVADEKVQLVTGMGFDLSFRGADHTSNGVRMGIDGWLYLAIGDYGYVEAKGRDGSTLHLRGGGVIRVRPDGTELENYALYARNIYDVAVSPKLDFFHATTPTMARAGTHACTTSSHWATTAIRASIKTFPQSTCRRWLTTAVAPVRAPIGWTNPAFRTPSTTHSTRATLPLNTFTFTASRRTKAPSTSRRTAFTKSRPSTWTLMATRGCTSPTGKTAATVSAGRTSAAFR